MMNTVDMFVQPFCVQNPVTPVEYKVLYDEVEEYLRRHYFPRKAGSKYQEYIYELQIITGLKL